MKSSRVSAFLLLTAGLLATPLLRAESRSDGFVEYPSLAPSASGDVVEVNLQGGLLSIASRVTEAKDPEVSKLLKGLKQVRVNVVKLDDSNREAATAQIRKLRTSLAKEGWESVVTVRDQKGEDVSVLMRTRGEEAIEGIVVTVLGKDDQAVFVNIVGELKPEQIAKVAQGLDIPALKSLDVCKKM